MLVGGIVAHACFDDSNSVADTASESCFGVARAVIFAPCAEWLYFWAVAAVGTKRFGVVT